MEKKYRSESYMTLVEILIATFILALGLVGIMSVVPVAMRHARSAIQTTHGASVAQNAKASLKRSRLYLSDDASDFTWGDVDFNDGIPEGIDNSGGERDDLRNNGFIDDFNGDWIAFAEPNTERSYGWRTEAIEELNDGRYSVTVMVYFPPPYEREVYRTTFMMRRP